MKSIKRGLAIVLAALLMIPTQPIFALQPNETSLQTQQKEDIRETEDAYELDIDLPGFKKDEVSLKLEQGYLTISAAKGLDKDDENKNGRYIRRDRYTGACSRSFYVGDQLKPEDISAKFEDGILKIHLPKAAPELPAQPNLIAIE